MTDPNNIVKAIENHFSALQGATPDRTSTGSALAHAIRDYVKEEIKEALEHHDKAEHRRGEIRS